MGSLLYAGGRAAIGAPPRRVPPPPPCFPACAGPCSRALPPSAGLGSAVRGLYRRIRPKVAELPNGLRVRYVSRPDVKFLYHEIFEERCYERGGVELRPGDVVLDVGGNIGMFALYCAKVCGPDGRVVTFEPIPDTFEALHENVGRQRAVGGALADVTAVNAGVGDGTTSQAEFTFYTRAAGWSSRYPSSDESASDVATFFDNSLQDLRGLDDSPLARAGQWAQASGPRWAYTGLRKAVTLWLLGGRRTVQCELTSVSRAMRELGIDAVDLLKVDVERAEMDVLRGVEDWGRVRQVAMEVHDVGGRLAEVVGLLEGEGFRVTAEQPPEVRGSRLWNLYAVQGAGG